MGELVFSDTYLVDLANRGLIPLANFLLRFGIGVGSLLLVTLGFWSFSRLGAVKGNARADQTAPLVKMGFAGIFAGGILFSGVSMLNIFGRTLTARDFSALSYSGNEFQDIQGGGNLSFVYTAAAVVALMLFISAAFKIYFASEDKKQRIGSVVAMYFAAGVLWQFELFVEALANTFLPNINQP